MRGQKLRDGKNNIMKPTGKENEKESGVKATFYTQNILLNTQVHVDVHVEWHTHLPNYLHSKGKRKRGRL